jgi:drug/metabolite transporter (DMT)-like permease
MTEAIIIIFITPILTGYASSLFLGERFSKKQFLAGVICFLGIIVVADPIGLSSKSLNPDEQPDSHHDSVSGAEVTPFQRFSAITLGLLADFAAAGAYTFIRLIGNKTHTLISVNYYAIFTTILSAFILVLPMFPDVNFRLPYVVREWILLAGIGVFGFLLQFLMTAALVIDGSSRTTNMMYSQIVFALILDWVIWGAVPTWTGWIGGVVVVSSVIWGSMQKDEGKGQRDEEYSALPAQDFELEEEGLDRSDNEGHIEESHQQSKSNS